MILNPTSMQQSLIYQEQLHGASINSIGGYLELCTDIDIESFKHARDLLIMTNDAFRIQVKHDSGSVYFITAKADYKELEVMDLSENPDSVFWFMDKKLTQAITLDSPQLFQDLLIIIGTKHYIYYAKAHHVIMDGWGFSLWGRRLINLYKKIQAGCPESLLKESYPSFIDCITNQKSRDEYDKYPRDKRYWLDKFSTLPDSLFPLSTNKGNDSYRLNNNSKRLSLEINNELYSLIECLATESKTGVLSVFLGVLYCYFTQINDKHEFVVGLPSHNRNSHQLKSIIGLLMNVNAMRFSFGNQLTFGQLIYEINRDIKSSYRYRRYPIEHLNRELQLLKHHRYSLYDISFNYQKFNFSLDLNGDAIEAHYLHNAAEQTPLVFTLCEYSGNRDISLHMDYRVSVINHLEAELMIQRIKFLLTQVCANSSLFLSDYDLLTEAERKWLLVAGRGPVYDYSKKPDFIKLLQIHGQTSCDKPAVTEGSVTLGYTELNERSEQLAATLLQRQFSSQTRIGLGFDRSIEMIVAILAVIKIGGVFIPLLPGLPKKRLEFMVKNSKIEVVLTLSKIKKYFDSTGVSCICVDDIKEDIKLKPHVCASVINENPAYIIYTSGSTGQPKGVCVSYRSLNNFLLSMQDRINCYHRSCWLSVTSPSFDISIVEYILPLLSGGHVILASTNSIDSNELKNLLSEYPINFMQATPATWQILMATNWAGDKYLQALCGGETLTDKLANQLLKKVGQLWNCYGPTETTIWSLVAQVVEKDKNYSAIGGPLANTEHYILNRHLCLLPRGAIGELYIGGAGVANGYDGLPELTTEKFIVNPFSSNSVSRLFKTGDMVRYLPCGKMDFLGRRDYQVKIRGFRIELGEIEAHLVKQVRVKEALVLARDSGVDNKYLVAYLVFNSSPDYGDKNSSGLEQVWINEVKGKLGQYCPDYMIPAAYIVLDKLPLTPNGKVDRKKLPVPDESNFKKGAYTAPENHIEKNLCNIWQRVLNVERVGVHDNFFQLGGHSLLATRVISLVREELAAELSLLEIFESPTVAELSDVVKLLVTKTLLPAITIINNRKQLPLSYAQQRLWFIDQLEGGSSQYNMSGAFRLSGHLNKQVFEYTLQTVLNRHEILRTNFKQKEGNAYQLIHSQITLPLVNMDFSGYEPCEKNYRITELINENINYQFDLKNEALLKVYLLRLSTVEHVMLFNMHHIISDGWSLGILTRELSELYNAFDKGKNNPLPALPVQYADYAYWQRQWLNEDILVKQLNYWQKRLLNIPLIHSLPLDKPRPAQQSFIGNCYEQVINKQFTQEIYACCQQHGVTLFMFLQTVFCILLNRFSNEADIVIGSPIAGRIHKDVESLIGFFVNTLVLRSDLSGNPDFDTLLQNNKKMILDAYTNQAIPFEMLVEELNPDRSLSHSPLFQILLTLQNNEVYELRFADLAVSVVEQSQTTVKFDIELIVVECNDGLRLSWHFNTDLFFKETIKRMGKSFFALLQGILKNTSHGVQTLPLLTKEQQHCLLIDWNNTHSNYPSGQCVHELFEQQVSKSPNQIAVVFKDNQLTYARLNELSNQLAWYLMEQGVKADSLVGLCVERSLEMMIGLLGILKAGAAYVPIDFSYPETRITYILEDSTANVVVTQKHLRNKLEKPGRVVILLDELEISKDYSGKNPNREDRGLTDFNLIYAIYTSGSTGRPKGVMIEHRNVMNLLYWYIKEYNLQSCDKVLIISANGFDLTQKNLLAPLLVGAGLYFATAAEYDVSKIRDCIGKHQISFINCAPSAFYPLLDDLESYYLLSSLRYVLLGGEAIDYKRFQPWFATDNCNAELVNMYGPTECTDIACSYPVPHRRILSANHGQYINLPIGRANSNVQLYVLNSYQQLVPVGVSGELYIGGLGLSRGYVNQPDLTHEKFIYVSLSENHNEKLYRTGDLARWQIDGCLEFVGRMDHQVKLRGYRLELGEIEAQLCASEQVQTAVVVMQGMAPETQKIIAYVLPTPECLADSYKTDEYLEEWATVFDDSYGKDNNSFGDFRISGWINSYTQEALSERSMREWVDGTIDRIHSMQPKKLLEIGSGTGLLLYRYAAKCEEVHALEISTSALSSMKKELRKKQWNHVYLHKGDALSSEYYHGYCFDTVVINSVIQYFPSSNYLLAVIGEVFKCMADGGKLFIGDVRNIDLLGPHIAAVEYQKAKEENCTVESFFRRVNRSIRREKELLVSPYFFIQLAMGCQDISHVDIMVKRGKENNEMMRYRYDVILYKCGGNQVGNCSKWFDWQNITSLVNIFELKQYDCFGVSGVPNLRIEEDVLLAQGMGNWLESSLVRKKLAEDMVVHKNSIGKKSIQLERLIGIAENYGYKAVATWSQDHLGQLDIIFSRGELPVIQARLPYRKKYLFNYPQLPLIEKYLSELLRKNLLLQLPDYMIPSYFNIVDKLPLTPNGKIDRKALLAMDDMIEKQAFIAPRNKAEELLCRLWQDVLKLEKIGVEDNFFILGGHSLLATRLISSIRQELNIELSLRDLFENPTISGLSQILSINENNSLLPAIETVDRSQMLHLSYAQQRLWFIDKLEEGSSQYNMFGAYQLSGRLNKKAFNKALNTIIRRHEVLRTNFNSKKGEAVQIVRKVVELPLISIDLRKLIDRDRNRQLDAYIIADENYQFDLKHELLLRVHLFCLEQKQHAVLVNMHHIASDGWSLNILIKEFCVLYTAFSEGEDNPLPPLPVQYVDYAHWQRQWLQGNVLEQQFDYWKAQLEGIVPVHNLPLDMHRSLRQSFSGDVYEQIINRSLLEAAYDFCQKQDVTLFMFLQTAFSILLSRHSNETDIVMGSPVAGRIHKDLEPLIGFFVNTLVLRSDLSGNPDFKTLLEKNQQMILNAYSHQNVPFEMLVEELKPVRSLSYNPIFQILFALQNNEKHYLKLPGLEIIPIEHKNKNIKFDLEVNVIEIDDTLNITWSYNNDLFYGSTIIALAKRYELLLSGILSKPKEKIQNISLLTEIESYRLLVEWNDTRNYYPKYQCVHELFEARVKSVPNNIALRFGDEQLSYQELNEQANQLAHYLIESGVRPDTLIGLCIERSLEMIVGILGIMKAGGAYLPVDPHLPLMRKKYIISDSGLRYMVTGKKHQHGDFFSGNYIFMDDENHKNTLQSYSSLNVAKVHIGLNVRHLLYCLYTSGTTGQPKGVLMPHECLVNLLSNQPQGCSLFSEALKTLQFTALSFDVACQEIMTTLISGGELVVCKEGLQVDLPFLLRLIHDSEIKRVFMPYAVLQVLAGEMMQQPDMDLKLRLVVTAGEALQMSPELRNMMSRVQSCRLVNHYGPSETHVVTSYSDSKDYKQWMDFPPIGKPLSNCRTYVLDLELNIVPVGVVGGLYIGGVGLSRGYLNQPELSNERFLQNVEMLNSEYRLYKTGDLVRWLPDGNLSFIGRADDQVKIRGFRVELNEITIQLINHKYIKEAIVLARKTDNNDMLLVAYIVFKTELIKNNGIFSRDKKAWVNDLKYYLKQYLPDYMVPSIFLILTELPLTSNGKINKNALPQPNKDDLRENAYVAPRNCTEEKLCDLWQLVLAINSIGVHDNFFELGGHSLLAVRLISLIRQEMETEVPLRTLFELPTVAELSKMVEFSSSKPLLPRIRPLVNRGKLPLSFSQQRLWFIDQLEGSSSQYNMSGAFELTGKFKKRSFIKSLKTIFDRHEVLRGNYKEEEGKIYQFIQKDISLPLIEIDLSGFDHDKRKAHVIELINRDIKYSFNLELEILFRVRLLKISTEEYVILFNMHHIISDGWSIEILIKELGQLYAIFSQGKKNTLPSLVIQYADYAHWQQSWLKGSILEQQRNYWKKQLSGIPSIHSLPLDKIRPDQQSFAGNYYERIINKNLSSGIYHLCRQQDVTLFVFLQTAFSILIGRYSNETDVVIGTPIAGRYHKDVESLIGFFANTLVLRSHFHENPSFNTVLQESKQRFLDAYAHQYIPFEMLVEELQPQRSLSYSPLFQIMLTVQNNNQIDNQFPELTLKPIKLNNTLVKFDIELMITECDDVLSLCWLFRTDLFYEETIFRMAESFVTLLQSIIKNPESHIQTLPLLTKEQQHTLLVKWNNTREDFARKKCIHELFEEQVKLNPEQLAVVFKDEKLTYDELNQQANQWAHYLIEQGVKPDSLVALCVKPSIEMIIGLLAVLKAGGAYVPIDPAYPESRIHCILEDCASQIVLSQKFLKEKLSNSGCNILLLDGYIGNVIYSSANPRMPYEEFNSLHLAYVIYTSGSTGQPKGVMINHRSGVNYLRHACCRYLDNDIVGSVVSSPLSFDATLTSILTPLCSGRYINLLPDDDNLISNIKYYLFDDGNSLLFKLTPSHLNGISYENIGLSNSDVRHVLVVGGEQLTVQSLYPWKQYFLPNSVFINEYGPTEATVGCCVYQLHKDYKLENHKTVLIGKPIINMQLYVLNQFLSLQTIGTPGELYIGGMGLARGYLNQQLLTKERFVFNPFSSDRKDKLYKSGDLVRWLPKGYLEFIGRVDHQVKIRGFRIELGEIENRLTQCSGVRASVVQMLEKQQDHKYLVAYIVFDKIVDDDKKNAITDFIKAELKQYLPDYMLPSVFVVLDSLPVTSAGKVNRKLLPLPVVGEYQNIEIVAPRNGMEKLLCKHWQDVLQVKKVGIYDNFFELGGHSLLAMRLISIIRQVLAIELKLRILFENPTVASLAEAIYDVDSGQVLSAITVVNDRGCLPLSYAQQRLWFIDQLEGESRQYNMPGAFKLTGCLKKTAFKKALKEIIQRHEVLRTNFKENAGEAYQVIQQNCSMQLLEVELHHMNHAQQNNILLNLINDNINYSFNLKKDILLRVYLFNLSHDEYVVLFNMHHIASDGWSMGILIKEFSQLYNAFSVGKVNPLPSLDIQYADYAYWQRQWLRGEVLDKQVTYWKKRLEGIPTVHSLPIDRPRPSQQRFIGKGYRQFIDKTLTRMIGTFCHQHDITLFIFMQTAIAVLLSHWSNEKDIVMGTPIAGRFHKDVESLIGLFINSLVLRVELKDNQNFVGLLHKNKQNILDAYAHQYVPFELLVEELNPERSLRYSPVFQIWLVLQNNEQAVLSMDGCKVSDIESFNNDKMISLTSKYDINIYIDEYGEELSCRWVYNQELFYESTIKYIAKQLDRLLVEIMKKPGNPYSSFDIFSANDSKQYYAFDPKEDVIHLTEESIIQDFQNHVKECPDSIAVKSHDKLLSYKELEIKSNQYAHYIALNRCRGNVGLLLGHNIMMVPCILALLKLPKTYVPLDVNYPVKRLQHIVNDADIDIIITNQIYMSIANSLVKSKRQVIINIDKLKFDEPYVRYTQQSSFYVEENPAAYILYTSGSTGEPKGVYQSELNLRYFARNYIASLNLNRTDQILLLSSFAFDASVMDLYGALLSGASLHVVDIRSVSSQEIADYISSSSITVLHSTPTVFKYIINNARRKKFLTVRAVVMGGEMVDQDVVEGFQEFFNEECLFINGYGPTESTLATQRHLSKQQVRDRFSNIGYPIPGTIIKLMNHHGRQSRVYEAGELLIESPYIALGYWKKNSLTAKKFTTLALGGRCYHSGDMGRLLADGSIEYLGRKDEQVKIRGKRIELREIEIQLTDQAHIKECVVITKILHSERKVVAYITVDDTVYNESYTDDVIKNRQITSKAREYLQASLPDYMVPSAFVILDKLPVTASGKLDRRALPLPDERDFYKLDYVAPRNEIEEILCNIWKEVLRVEKVGVNDNFFELGGHSLSLMQVYSRIRDLGFRINIKNLFECQTISSLFDTNSKENKFLSVIEKVEFPDELAMIKLNESSEKYSVFCIHPIGGIASCYTDLAKGIEDFAVFYGLQVPYLFSCDQMESVELLVEYYMSLIRSVQPHGPYYLLGWSLGGRLAYELAFQLAGIGEAIAYLGVFDACPAIHKQFNGDMNTEWFDLIKGFHVDNITFDWDKLRTLSPDDGINLVAEKITQQNVQLEYLDQSMVIRHLYYLFHLSHCLHDYSSPVSGLDIDLFKVKNNIECQSDNDASKEDYGWGELASGKITVIQVKGTHEDMLQPPFVDGLLDKLKLRLRESVESYSQVEEEKLGL